MSAEKFSYSLVLNLPRASVWNGLFDVEVMRRCIPDCEELELVSDRQLRATVKYKIGPITRRFRSSFTITDIVPGQLVRFRRGGLTPYQGMGAFNGEARLSDEGAGTRIDASIDLEAPGAVIRLIRMLYLSNPGQASGRFAAKFEQAVRDVFGQSQV